jgi:hypothetical protein
MLLRITALFLLSWGGVNGLPSHVGECCSSLEKRTAHVRHQQLFCIVLKTAAVQSAAIDVGRGDRGLQRQRMPGLSLDLNVSLHFPGLRASEAKAINLSLTTLGICINSRADRNSKHTPFRDSKLTRLLQVIPLACPTQLCAPWMLFSSCLRTQHQIAVFRHVYK